MYEARQNKEQNSRTLSLTERKATHQIQKKENSDYVFFLHNLLQMKPNNDDVSSNDIESLIEEAIDESEKRLRQYNTVKYVRENQQHIKEYYTSCNNILKRLRNEYDLLQKHKESNRLKAKKRRIRNKIQRYEEEVKKYSRFIQGINDFNLSYNHTDFENAEKDWIENDNVQSVNIRVLSNWHSDGKLWKERNENSGRKIQKGEFLNVEKGWTDYINQGWMQRGYERNVLFRILTHINDFMIEEHNNAALSGKWIEYEEWILKNCKNTLFNKSRNCLTFFGQEMVNLARNKYMLMKDSSGRLNAIPYLKFKMLSELKAKR